MHISVCVSIYIVLSFFPLLSPDGSESLAIMAELRPEAEKLGKIYAYLSIYIYPYPFHLDVSLSIYTYICISSFCWLLTIPSRLPSWQNSGQRPKSWVRNTYLSVYIYVYPFPCWLGLTLCELFILICPSVFPSIYIFSLLAPNPPLSIYIHIHIHIHIHIYTYI